MSSLTIFIDLDNTIYNQEPLIRYALREICKKIDGELDRHACFRTFMKILRSKGLHARIFDRFLERTSIDVEIDDLVKMFREKQFEYIHKNGLKAYASAIKFLREANSVHLRVIVYTEGQKALQELKVKSLGIEDLIEGVIVVKSKLSPENASIFKEERPVLYIGDDPYVDFYIPNMLGIPTIRVLTGLYKNVSNSVRGENYAPRFTVRRLSKKILKIRGSLE